MNRTGRGDGYRFDADHRLRQHGYRVRPRQASRPNTRRGEEAYCDRDHLPQTVVAPGGRAPSDPDRAVTVGHGEPTSPVAMALSATDLAVRFIRAARRAGCLHSPQLIRLAWRGVVPRTGVAACGPARRRRSRRLAERERACRLLATRCSSRRRHRQSCCGATRGTWREPTSLPLARACSARPCRNRLFSAHADRSSLRGGFGLIPIARPSLANWLLTGDDQAGRLRR